MRGEFYLFRRARLDAVAFVDRQVGEEAGVVMANAVHAVRDDFGVFVHATHGGHRGRNLSSFKEASRGGDGDGATAAGVSDPIPLADLPSEAMRRLLRAHRDAFKNKETLGPAWMPRSLDDDVGALSVS